LGRHAETSERTYVEVGWAWCVVVRLDRGTDQKGFEEPSGS